MPENRPHPWCLPLSEFVAHVLDEDRIAERPEWHSPVWHLVRMMRGFYPEGTQPELVFSWTDEVVRSRAGGWQSAYGLAEDEAFAMWCVLWPRVRYRPDETPLGNALVRATACPLRTERSERRPMPGYDRFVSLAGWLQVGMGDKAIILPCREVAETLDTGARLVSVWRRLAVEDEYLVETRPHIFQSERPGRATEFRFNIDRWKPLRECAQRGSRSAFYSALPVAPDEDGSDSATGN